MSRSMPDKQGGMRALWLVLAGWLVLTVAAQASGVTVHASLSRTQVALGDTVTLTVEVDGASQSSAPDVSALAGNFDILGTSRSTSINIVNGQRSVKSLWAVQLRPLHAGALSIPALNVDGHATAPLTLSVGAASATSRGRPGGPVLVEVKPSTLTPYVGQQIDLDVRLFYAPNIDSGSLDVPHGKHVQVRPLGNGVRFQAQRNGRFYQVLERHYAVTAAHAGPLNLAPIVFQGTMRVAGNFGGFFGNGQAVAARSAPIHLAVRARPADSGKGLWLPARQLTLQLTGLPSGGQLKVGQALTLTLTENVVGLPFEVLPKPQLPTLAGVDVYPDQSQDHTGNDGRWLTGTRTRKFALVVQQAGTLVIPAITLDWWNVKTGRAEVASIPAHTLTVTAAMGVGHQAAPALPVAPATAGSAAAMPVARAAGPSVHANEPPTATVAPVHAAPAHDVLAWVALGLWLATVLGLAGVWGWRRRRAIRAPSVAPSAPALAKVRHLQQAFMQTCVDGDVAAQCASLMAWARATRPALQHLGELAAVLDSPAQCAAIADLQRARYTNAGRGPGTETLQAAFREGLAWRKPAQKAAPGAALPPLYP